MIGMMVLFLLRHIGLCTVSCTFMFFVFLVVEALYCSYLARIGNACITYKIEALSL